jgi:hypothetical protein
MSSQQKMKSEYLTLYDYGQGGVWAVIAAQSKDDILKRFPELVLVEQRPAWLDNEIYRKLVHCDVDAPTGWLKVLEESR